MPPLFCQLLRSTALFCCWCSTASFSGSINAFNQGTHIKVSTCAGYTGEATDPIVHLAMGSSVVNAMRTIQLAAARSPHRLRWGGARTNIFTQDNHI